MEVRKAWVGVCLPTIDDDARPRTARTAGVVSGPKSFIASLVWALLGRGERASGYRVNAAVALQILQERAPDAASWWHMNAPPRSPNQTFLFHAEACEPISEVGFAAP